MNVADAYKYFYIGVLVVLALLLVFVFVRVVRGPLMADRIVGINSIGTLVIVTVCVLARYLGEDYLLDIAILYALISFLAVVVLTKIYSGVYKNRLEEQRKKKQEAAAAQAMAASADIKADTGVRLTDREDREVHHG